MTLVAIINKAASNYDLGVTGKEVTYIYLFIIYFVLEVQVINRLNERIDHN